MNRPHLHLPVFALLLAGLGTALLAGCTGKQGPAGADGTAVDNVPPSVVMLSPTYGDTVSGTLIAKANAVDNVGVDHVSFYLDGSSQTGDSTYSAVFTSPYADSFDLAALHVQHGIHTLMARAYDLDGNVGDSPPLVIYTVLVPPTGPYVLKHWTPDSLTTFAFPKRVADGDTTRILDSLFSVRFENAQRCQIDSVRIWLDSIPDEPMVYDRPLRIGLYRSNGVYPVVADSLTASVLIDTANVRRVGWHSVAFAEPVELESHTRFHVTFTVDQPTDTTYMATRVSVRDAYPFDSDNASGFYYRDPFTPHWVTLQEYLPASGTALEFLVEVKVTFLE